MRGGSDLGQRRPGRSLRARNLERIDHAGDATTFCGFFRARAGDVVSHQHGGGCQPLKLQHFTRHVKIHAVPTVVTVKAQDASPAVGQLHGLNTIRHTGTSKHVANSTGIEQSVTAITGKDGQVTGSTARDHAHLAGDSPAGPVDNATAGAATRIKFRMSETQTIQRLVSIIARGIKQFFHGQIIHGAGGQFSLIPISFETTVDRRPRG